jgi:NAD(P)-dependent dehydrogenase (short-subunit alcohol dehydrogenase family)
VNTQFDKTVIVTGAGSGIGLATARLFASKGARLVLVDMSEEKLKSASEIVESSGASGVWTSVCDVSKEEEVIATVSGAMKKFQTIDVIVNNAGLMIFKSFEDHTKDDWLKVLNVDLLGSFYFTREAFRHMKNGGAVVNVSSVHAVETTPLVASYAAAKAALLSLTRSAAIEGKEKGIRVNAVLPGAIDTPMLWQNPNIKSGLEVINQKDVGKAEDIASAIFYLSTDEAHFIQGVSLRVDGGRLAKLS